jgi:hypothetical protein
MGGGLRVGEKWRVMDGKKGRVKSCKNGWVKGYGWEKGKGLMGGNREIVKGGKKGGD